MKWITIGDIKFGGIQEKMLNKKQKFFGKFLVFIKKLAYLVFY